MRSMGANTGMRRVLSWAAFAVVFAGAAACGGSGGDGDLVTGCPGQSLRRNPTDLAAAGPWPVGAITTTVAGIRTEVWYPAVPRSEQGRAPVVYDIRDHLPAADVPKVSDAENPIQQCACYRDLPVDGAAGPYPIVVFIHGTAGFRTQNLENATHWASRGFVVVASDHPGIWFSDLVQGNGRPDQVGDARRVLAELARPSGDLAFLAGHVDPTRQGAVGHSAGGAAASLLGDVAQVLVPLAGGTGAPPVRPASVMFIRGTQDFGDGRPGEQAQWQAASSVKRSVLIARGEHLVGSSLCGLRDPRDPSRDLLQIIREERVAGIVGIFAGALFRGCNDVFDENQPFLSVGRGIEIVNYTSAGALEETLQCSAEATRALAETPQRFGADVDLYREDLG